MTNLTNLTIDGTFKNVDVIISSENLRAMKCGIPVPPAEMRRYESIRSSISKDRPAIALGFMESKEVGITRALKHVQKYRDLIYPLIRERVVGDFIFTEGNRLLKFEAPETSIQFWFEVKGDTVAIRHNLEAATDDEVIAE